jgi:iron complex transport system ATP-binding protein
MAGGGSGELLMRALADAHIPFIAGALNIGDSDHTLALRLATTVITEQPYTPISSVALQQVHESLLHISILIICPMPIGPGNLALLQEALDAAQNGLPVLLLTASVSKTIPASEQSTTLNEHMAAQDYTGGQGLKILHALIQAGAVVVESVGEAVEFVKKRQ